MKRVLIASVGGSPEPIVNAITQTRPDFVYFLASTGASGSDRTIEGTTTTTSKVDCAHCGKTSTPTRAIEPIAPRAGLVAGGYTIERLDYPDNLANVVAAVARIAVDLDARFAGEDREVTANYTGGTKTMAVGLVVSALRAGWSLQFNGTGGARTNLTKITAGDLPLPQDATVLLLRDAVTMAREQAARHAYEAAVETLTLALTRMRLPPAEQAELGTLRTEYEVHAARDRFDYEGAREAAGRDDRVKALFAAKLHKLIQTRALCQSGDWTRRDLTGAELVEDIVENAVRCAQRGRYDDAVGRLYRATELVAQVQLLRKHKVRTGEVDPGHAAIPEASRGWLDAKKEANGKVKLGLFEAYRLLDELDDPLGKYFVKNQGRLRTVVLARNESLFAHGLTPITGETWEHTGSPWREWLLGALAAATST